MKINAWMNHLAETYPHLVTLKSIGTSYEGYPLKMAWIHTGQNPRGYSVWIDGGTSATIAVSISKYRVKVVGDQYKYRNENKNFRVGRSRCQ
jgi:hypothetical protein